MIFVTGLEYAKGGQEWNEYGSLLDQSIVEITSDDDIHVSSGPKGWNQEFVALTGKASGQTVY